MIYVRYFIRQHSAHSPYESHARVNICESQCLGSIMIKYIVLQMLLLIFYQVRSIDYRYSADGMITVIIDFSYLYLFIYIENCHEFDE